MRRLHSLVLLLLPRLLPRLLLLLLLVLLLLMLLQLPPLPVGRALFVTRGAYVDTNTRLVAPYLDYSITYVETLF